MASLDERAEVLRRRMVDRIRALGVDDERVLEAMLRIPRHWFLENVHDLDLVHHIERAIAVPGSFPDEVTTSVSAPGLVASMLQELDLRPRLRVLEIGAGSGYNAALIAELVGDGALVTTIDIDHGLIEPARRRLAAVGHGDVRVVEGDGDAGVAGGAPFDRIVATVGCNDLSPAWFEQLAPGGFMLVPLRHGRMHPLVRAADGTSRVVGRSGFVRMLGRQDGLAPWEIPLELGWDAAYFAALHVLPGVPADAEVLRALAERWRDLGEPSVGDFVSTWVPLGTGRGRWVVPRIHHDQVVELPSFRA